MMCTILLVYVMVTIHKLIRYNILLIHEMIIIKYRDIVFLIGYHIFCTLLPGCYYETILLDVHPPNHYI